MAFLGDAFNGESLIIIATTGQEACPTANPLPHFHSARYLPRQRDVCGDTRAGAGSRSAGPHGGFRNAAPAAAGLHGAAADLQPRSEEHTSELQSLRHLVCRLL